LTAGERAEGHHHPESTKGHVEPLWPELPDAPEPRGSGQLTKRVSPADPW
jgi:hypothetical protein